MRSRIRAPHPGDVAAGNRRRSFHQRAGQGTVDGNAKQFTLADGTALDLPALLELGRNRGVKLIKAMQCLNIAEPLGQGLWEGVPLREVLRLCGPLRSVRRIYYWGFHNNDPAQIFQSSLSYTQALETAPGELPPFLAYRLNGEPIPLKRGGPVRMIVPWAHGFKSIKWLQRITLTNDFKACDTYANSNNDPESHLKTAAYIDQAPEKYSAGQTATMSGLVISGIVGFATRRALAASRRTGREAPVTQDDEIYSSAQTGRRANSKRRPSTGVACPSVRRCFESDVLGFDSKTGKPAHVAVAL